MAERQTQKAQTLRRNRVGSNPIIRIRTILTDLLDGLNSNEEKWSERLTFYIYDIAYRALKKTEDRRVGGILEPSDEEAANVLVVWFGRIERKHLYRCALYF